MIRKYQAIIILKSDAKDAVKEIKDSVAAAGGQILSEDAPTERKLAYQISGHREGSLYRLSISGPEDLPAKLLSSLKISSEVLRFLITLDPSKVATKKQDEKGK